MQLHAPSSRARGQTAAQQPCVRWARGQSKVTRFLVRERERFAGDHFGIRDVAAQLQAQLAKGDIVHAGHGSKEHGNGAAG